ncbi:MAG: hypothetical protein WA160_13715 [Pseudobdellovibrio sp.]
MKQKTLASAVGLVSYLFSVSLLAGECSQLVLELQAMKKANSAIHSSLIANHEMFSTTLESYSEALSETAGRAHKTVSDNMLSSSQSFRERGLKAQKMSRKLDLASEDLIQRVSKCIK